MAQLGADDVEVDRLAATFDRTAGRLTASEQAITALVRSVVWIGPDAADFRGKWNGAMRAQMLTVSDRLRGAAGDLRKQAQEQRQASDGTGPVLVPSNSSANAAEEMLELKRLHAEAMQRMAIADAWADETGRLQIRDTADRSEQAQLEWWRGLTDDQRAALLRNDPGALFGLEGLPAEVRAEARTAYIDSVRGDIELSSHEDKLAGELTIAWVHLGVEGTAAIVQLADGTYRVDLGLTGEVGAKLGKGGSAEIGVGAGVAQSYEFDSQAEAEAFVHGLYDKLTPDVDWSIFKGPSGLMADTVDDVIGYLGDHADQRTSFEGELKLQGEVELELGAFDVKLNGEAGAKYDFDTHETTAFLKAAFEGDFEVPSAGDGTTASYQLSADLEAALKWDEHGQVSELQLKGSLGGEASVGLEQFLNGTTPKSKHPESISLDVSGGAKVEFEASLDLQDPIVQQRAAELLNGMGSTGGISLTDLQALLRESEMQVQIDARSIDKDKWDIGIASLEISHTDTANVVTWVKPPGGDFTYVSPGELTGGSQ